MAPELSLAFLWHLHQPVYRPRGERVCFLPWVRLHGIRSYYDMVRVLEEFPEVRVTLNLVPSLVEQIRAYEKGATDLFLETGAVPAEDLGEAQRSFLFEHFFSAQVQHMIGPLPRFSELLERRNRARRVRGSADAWKEFSTSDYRDLQALFDLCWFGFKAREEFPGLRSLARKGRGYTQEDIREIHQIERRILANLLPSYQQAAARGQIEISTTPYAHPILPLLLDSHSAREALPRAQLPPRLRLPRDARVQVEDAMAAMEREFGRRPRGIWPSEGAVSPETVQLLASGGVGWTASDEQVLARSERDGSPDVGQAWEADLETGAMTLLFRDHDLSDRIGFTYCRMRAEEAAANFVAAVEGRAHQRPEEPSLLLVALDGENPWEHYARGGARFLRALYGSLVRSRRISCRTVEEALAAAPRRGKIRRLWAGSWINADFGTWIGGPEKNHAWTILGRVRSDLAAALEDPRLPEESRNAAWACLRAAEGSDWFWWLDGQFSSLYRAQFDQTFRTHLRLAYEAVGRAAPDFLSWPISQAVPQEADGGLSEPFIYLSPRIDGFEGDLFEWEGAETIPWVALSPASTLERGRPPLELLWFGFSRSGEFFLRIDPPPPGGPGSFARLLVELSFRAGEATRQLTVELDEAGDLRRAGLRSLPAAEGESAVRPSSAAAAAHKIFELAVPFDEVGLRPGEPAFLRVSLRKGEEAISLREIDLRVPSLASRARIWSVL